jgi:hypothetical protein
MILLHHYLADLLDSVSVSSGNAGIDDVQELEKLATAMAPMQFSDCRIAGDVQCCEISLSVLHVQKLVFGAMAYVGQ